MKNQTSEHVLTHVHMYNTHYADNTVISMNIIDGTEFGQNILCSCKVYASRGEAPAGVVMN